MSSSGNESDNDNISVVETKKIKHSKLKDLITMRATAKGRLTKFKNFFTQLSDISIEKVTNVQVRELKVRLAKIETLFDEFDKHQTKIELLTNDEQQHNEREVFESQFYQFVSCAQEIIDSHLKLHNDKKEGSVCSFNSLHNDDHHHINNNIKLPTINLPSFDGDYLKWLEFRDTFDSLINSNQSISNITKFHYLRSSLQGSATVVIKSIEFTSQNYTIAWTLLCERYDNKKILINNHLKVLFNIEAITRESHKAIRFLIDQISKNLRALESLGQPVDKWDILIIYIMSTKLDPTTLRKWEEFKSNCSNVPTLTEFIKFLRNRADILETMVVNRSDKPEHKYSPTHNKEHKKPEYDHKNSFQHKSLVASNKPNLSCPFCNQSHRIVDCNSFQGLSPEGRSTEASKLNLCFNCLRRGHAVHDCRINGTCRICNQRHNTLLHINKNNNDNHAVLNSLPVSLSTQTTSQVLLGTAILKVINPETKHTYLVRALLDAGSQSSFITCNLKHKLGLISQNSKSCVTGISNAPMYLSDSCELIIQSLVSPFSVQLKCLVMPQITGHLPNFPVNVSQLNLPSNIKLADPKFYVPSSVDMLLGAEIFFEIISQNQIKSGPGMPILQDSKLGWIVVGPLNTSFTNNNHETSCNFSKEISDSLSRFWTLEELPSSKVPLSADDEYCEQHFVNNTTRLGNGRFSVMMPIRESPETLLGDSYLMAEKRFLNLENKLNKNLKLKNDYCSFIKEYEELGHLIKIKRPSFGYYMPHHAVIKESRETTKLRVVFDASAKTTSQKSLNDIQGIGPVVQDELFNILVRFRCHKFVLTGDIIKMYRQVSMNTSQRHLQLILWRDDDSRPIETLQLNTVTYGTASAPFLSTRCLIQLAKECPDPILSTVIKNDFYIDDLLTGASNEHDLAHIHKGVSETLASACFPIHKFRTNCPQIFSEATESDILDINKESSVLGVLWAPDTDIFKFSINVDMDTQHLTKRIILSNTCKIFDPLGLLSASTITLKILLQKLWQLKLDWDDPVPKNIKNIWEKLTHNLQNLLSLSVPRLVLCSSPLVTELHCFVDASKDAYAASVYLRSIDINNIVEVQLLCSKTRVAPLKTTTIPRLELCAALLGARLVAKLSEALRCVIHSTVFWSDSTITLSWIKTQPKLLKAFVCNRVNEIRELTDRDSWRHVPTDQNPADMASRGVEPNVLIHSKLWWHGPSFLLNSDLEWPQPPNIKVDLPEIKVNHTKHNDLTQKIINFENYSNAPKLIRILAYVFRFINNSKTRISVKSPLDDVEIKNALHHLIKWAQLESFPLELDILTKEKALKPKSYLLQLSPFIDATGVLRVGGRLDNTALKYEKKHPALLDAKHHFTKILMAAEHLRLFHAGPQLLLSSFRDQFWPIGGRTLARSIVRKCIICTKLRPKLIEPLFGNLPLSRASQNYPFQVCGTDFAGPFMISSKKGRGNKISKCYLCLFVCFSTKALHLEVVSDLSAQAFIMCLKRFIARRGKPHSIHCDNGKNFVGASNELGRELRSSLRSIQEFSANEGVKFIFNPPYSPTFGGLWEAGVKSAKHHLKRIAADASFTFEELSTLFTQIEAILNSRPLTPLSPDPNDLTPLTPGHFLIGRPLTTLPAPPCENLKFTTRYQFIEKCRQHFWNRWSKEYLTELQQRTKWRLHQKNLNIGDLVILKEENLPPLKWKLGRVQHLYSGSDGVCRVADFKTQRGTERRAINRVCLLPVEEVLKEASTSSFQGGAEC